MYEDISEDLVSAQSALQDRLGYKFKDLDLLVEALTHPSATKRHRHLKHNQRLEFLGDRVVGLVIADLLFSLTEEEDEGILTRWQAYCVENTRLSEVAKGLDIGGAMIVQSKIISSRNDKILADALEAVIGAIWRDGGIEAVRAVMLKIWAPMIQDNIEGVDKDGKTRLQEYVHKHGLKMPRYEVESQRGPPHDVEFTVTVICGGKRATGKGSSKKQGEQMAAESWLEQYIPKSDYEDEYDDGDG